MEWAERIAKVYRLLGTIAKNIALVRGEIPSLAIPGGLGLEIATLCDEFDSALYDIRKEVRVLEDKLGIHPGEEPFDPEVMNADPGATISLIMGWLQQATEDLDAAVMKVQGLTEHVPGLGAVEVLLEESGANILGASHAIRDELRLLSAGRDRTPGRPTLTDA